jgi:hypothetical protein
MDAPPGYTWKFYKMRQGRRYPVGNWAEIVYVSAGMDGAEMKVLVKNGEKAAKGVDPPSSDR